MEGAGIPARADSATVEGSGIPAESSAAVDGTGASPQPSAAADTAPWRRHASGRRARSCISGLRERTTESGIKSGGRSVATHCFTHASTVPSASTPSASTPSASTALGCRSSAAGSRFLRRRGGSDPAAHGLWTRPRLSRYCERHSTEFRSCKHRCGSAALAGAPSTNGGLRHRSTWPCLSRRCERRSADLRACKRRRAARAVLVRFVRFRAPGADGRPERCSTQRAPSEAGCGGSTQRAAPEAGCGCAGECDGSGARGSRCVFEGTSGRGAGARDSRGVRGDGSVASATGVGGQGP